MKKENFLVVSTDIELEKYSGFKNCSEYLKEKENAGTNYIPLFPSLLFDIFCSFYLKNPEMKKIENTSPLLWQNYYLLESLTGHYQYKNIHSSIAENSQNAFWVTEIFADEFMKLLTSKKKIIDFFKISHKFFSEIQNEGFFYSDLKKSVSSKEEAVKIKKISSEIINYKKETKTIIIKIMMELNKIINKTQPLMILIQGHNLSPLSLTNIPNSKKNDLVEKLANPKLKEIIKIFSQLDLTGKIQSKENDLIFLKKKDVDDFSQEIFYLNELQDEQKDKLKNWIKHEMAGYDSSKRYSPLTVCLQAGNPESSADELEIFAVSLGMLEVARLEKRNLMAIISGLSAGEKTYIFTPQEVTVLEKNESVKLDLVEGTVLFLTNLLSGPLPPKSKKFLNISFGSKPAETKRKKIFKKKPTLIRFG
ncbi:hypothetical protein HY745_09510 [Candidatus Desantisbacteria bacterium]|nr:hypothetical protein [Candidatus Desantisbacteria bacterium]